MVASFLTQASSLAERASRLLSRTEHVVHVLRVGLRFYGSGAELQFDLAQRGSASDEGRRVWKFPITAIGAPDTLHEPVEPLVLPAQLVEGLRDALASPNVSAEQPLWLDLLRPYGFLGTLPWEATLGEALDRPIVRLPSFLETPQEDQDFADVAVLVCADPFESRERTLWQVRRITDAILGGSRRLQTRVHLFAPEPWCDLLGKEALDAQVRIHAPPSASEEPFGRNSRLKDWTDWIGVALDGQTVDAVHLIGDAEPSAVGAVFMLMEARRTRSVLPDDEAEEGWPAIAVSIEDLCALLTHLGAWALAFTPSVAANPALAFLADAVAHVRPGPLLYQRIDTAEDADELLRSYRFILSPEPIQAPRLSSGFLYGLPSMVAHTSVLSLDPAEAALDATLLATSALTPPSRMFERRLRHAGKFLPGIFAQEIAQLPNWASAAQRFMETATLDELRRLSGDVLLSRANAIMGRVAPETYGENTEVVRRTLSDIRDIIQQHLSSGASAIDRPSENRTWREEG